MEIALWVVLFVGESGNVSGIRPDLLTLAKLVELVKDGEIGGLGLGEHRARGSSRSLTRKTLNWKERNIPRG